MGYLDLANCKLLKKARRSSSDFKFSIISSYEISNNNESIENNNIIQLFTRGINFI